MVGNGNLIPFTERTHEERVALAKKGNLASQKTMAQKRTFKKIFEMLLTSKAIDGSNLTNDELMAMQMIKEAVQGNVKAFEVVRDTVGQKPVDKQEIDNNITINNYKELTVEELKKLAGE